MLLTVCLAFPTAANAFEVEGRVLDALSGASVAGARVTAHHSGSTSTSTDDDGTFTLRLEEALRGHPVDFTVVPPNGDTAPLTWRRRDTSGFLRLLVHASEPTNGPPNGNLAQVTFGVPPDRSSAAPQPASAHAADPLAVDLTGIEWPETIRVRMFPDGDFTQPAEGIVEVPFEDYVEGVVISEIGVFRSLSSGDADTFDVFATFAIAARSYGLYYYLQDPDAAYHLDNTARKQRFEDVHNAEIREAVDATTGLILTKLRAPNTLEAFEYAASCGGTSTLPEFGERDRLVDDVIPETDRACVGAWCGHDTCAAHEVHPDFQYEDGRRCLVRGICQWGAAERSARGETWQQIVAHYQPWSQVSRGGEVATASLVGIATYPDGSPAGGLTISAQPSGAATTTDQTGYFRFLALEAGDVLLSASAAGVDTAQRNKTIVGGITNWASIEVDRPTPALGTGNSADTETNDAAAPPRRPNNTVAASSCSAAGGGVPGSTTALLLVLSLALLRRQRAMCSAMPAAK